MSDSYITDDLRARADDITWRAQVGDRYVYFLIEFQSSVEPFMAVRVLTYVGLLYQDVIRAKVVECKRGLPAILPIVLYNGSSRWRAAEEIATLLPHVPDGLEEYSPQLRYLLIDEGSYDDTQLAGSRNLAAMLFRLENCSQHHLLEELVSTLVDWLRSPEHDSLRRAFAVWLERVILVRLTDQASGELTNLWEKETMLSENFDRWEEEFRQEGRKAGRQEGRQEGEMIILRRQLRKRFGDLPEWVHDVLRDAGTDQLEQWGERMLEVTSLHELFGSSATVGASPSR